ncbi:MAG: hypothetical protein ABI898_12740, partial [Sphingomonadales bacterium]
AQSTLIYCGEVAFAKHLQQVEDAVADGTLDPDGAAVMREIVAILTGYPTVIEKGAHPIAVSLAGELAGADRMIRTPAAMAAITKLIGA